MNNRPITGCTIQRYYKTKVLLPKDGGCSNPNGLCHNLSPASQLCGSQPYRDVQRTSIIGITTLGLSGYDMFRTRKSSNTTLVHRLRTADGQDISVQNVTNELDRDFSSNSEENRKVVMQDCGFSTLERGFRNTTQIRPQALNHNHNLTTPQPTGLCMLTQANCGSHP